MPRGDGTGPMGRGALTGRGLGSCAGASVPLYGMGYGRGMGRGAGLGYGCRRGARFFWDTAGPQTDREFLDIDFMDENKKEDIGVFEDADVIGAVNTRVIDEYIKSDTKSLDKILKDVTEDETLYNNIKEGSRKRNLSRYKKEFIDIATKSGYTMEEIGKSISISATAIFKIHNAQ